MPTSVVALRGLARPRTVGSRVSSRPDMSDHHETLDCSRLLCPLPVIRVQDRVEQLAPGSVLTAVCTDPGALQDIPAWCRINGHTVLGTEVHDGEYRVTLRVTGADTPA